MAVLENLHACMQQMLIATYAILLFKVGEVRYIRHQHLQII